MKIAISQIDPIIGDIAGNNNKILSNIDIAIKGGADLVIFPEMATIGYPPMDLLLNKKIIADNISSIKRVAEKSKDIAIICGFVDYDHENPNWLYNAALFAADGKIVSKHYKTLLPSYDVFDETRYFSQAKTQTPVRYKDKLIGITICEDILNDKDFEQDFRLESRSYPDDPIKNLAAKNIDLLVNISASPFVSGKNVVKRQRISDIANKYSLPIVYVNQIGGNDSLIFDGYSFFVNNRGELIAKAKGFEEDIIFVDDDKDLPVISIEEDLVEDIRKALVLGIRDYVNKCGFSDVIVGLSGGIDSALTATLAVQALGKDSVMGITMPSPYSSKGSVLDSIQLAKNLGIRIEEIPIETLFSEYKVLLKDIFLGRSEDVTEENLQARIRGNLLMAVSNKFGSLLLTTGNKSELAMGYCTMYGDMAGGLAVISDLPKTLVYRMAEHINTEKEVIPIEIIEKPPSAELRENQKDEDSLPPYDILDNILEMYIEKRMPALEIEKQGYNRSLVDDILKNVDRSEYKRRQAPPGLKVTSKAFGIGRRLPIAQRSTP